VLKQLQNTTSCTSNIGLSLIFLLSVCTRGPHGPTIIAKPVLVQPSLAHGPLSWNFSALSTTTRATERPIPAWMNKQATQPGSLGLKFNQFPIIYHDLKQVARQTLLQNSFFDSCDSSQMLGRVRHSKSHVIHRHRCTGVHIFGDAKKFCPNLILFFPNCVYTASHNVKTETYHCKQTKVSACLITNYQGSKPYALNWQSIFRIATYEQW